MKVGFVQFKPEFGDKKANLDKIAALAKQERSDLLVFPEMCTTGYVVKSKIELKDLAEEIPSGPTATELVKIAKGVGSILIAGLPEIVGRKIYNSAVVVGPGGYIAKHQKSHLFLNESKYFSPGQTKPTIFKWQEFRIGLGICYDYMFPEYWRTLALQGADLFCNPANFVFDYGHGAWLPLYRTLTERIITLNPGVFGILLILFEVAMELPERTLKGANRPLVDRRASMGSYPKLRAQHRVHEGEYSRLELWNS